MNAQDLEGNTAFDWADDYGHGSCSVLLWRNGAQIKTQTGKRAQCYPTLILFPFPLTLSF